MAQDAVTPADEQLETKLCRDRKNPPLRAIPGAQPFGEGIERRVVADDPAFVRLDSFANVGEDPIDQDSTPTGNRFPGGLQWVAGDLSDGLGMRR